MATFTSKKGGFTAGDFTELKSFLTPPVLVKDVLSVAMLLLGHTPKEAEDWAFIKKMLGKSGKDSMLVRMQNLDSSTVTPETREKARALIKEKDITIEKASNSSMALASMLQWELSIIG